VLVYLNGDYIPREDARISIDDRGFLFADGIYEVVRLYGGTPFRMADHLARARRGLDALEIRYDDVDGIADVCDELVRRNDLEGAEATMYLQITRGAAPRKHAFPAPDTPATVYTAVKEYRDHPAEYWTEGVAAITVGDNRWSRCDIKSISLLPNVLANQRAHAKGAFEGLFIRDGIVLEGSHSNLFAVYDGELVTYPLCNLILGGITRAVVFELAEELGIPAREGLIPESRLFDADELFLAGTTTEVMPIVTVDGTTIADGKPGPVTKKLQEALRAKVS